MREGRCWGEEGEGDWVLGRGEMDRGREGEMDRGRMGGRGVGEGGSGEDGWRRPKPGIIGSLHAHARI